MDVLNAEELIWSTIRM